MTIAPIEAYVPHPATARAQSVEVSYDKVYGRIAYAMGRSIFVKPVDAKSSVRAFQFTKHTTPTTVAAFSSNGNYIASGDESGQVKVWETLVIDDKNPLVEQPYIKSEFPILSGPIKSIAWDGDNARIIAVGEGKEKFGQCFTWDSGNSVGEIQGHSDVINSVDIKPQRPYRAATVGNDKALVFYTGPPFKFDKSVRDHHTNIIRAVKFSPDGKYLISVGSDRLIVVYDGKTGEFIRKIENAHDGGIFAVAWFEDSTKFATASADNSVKIWSADTFEAIKTLKASESVTVSKQLVGLVVTEAYVIALSLNGDLNYFSNEDDSLQVIEGHQSAITASTIIGKALFTGGSDGRLFKWGINEKTLDPVPESLDGHSNYVVDLLHAGEYLVSIGWDDKVKVWDHKTLKLVSEQALKSQPKKLALNGNKVTVLFESGYEVYEIDGGVIKSEEEIKLKYDTNGIDALTGKLLLTNLNENKLEDVSASLKFEAIRGQPSIVRVSPDEKYIALGDSTGKYIIYNADASVKTTRWTYHSSKILDSKWSPDSQFLLSGGLDTTLLIYSIKKLSKVIKFPLAHQLGISKVEWLSYEAGLAVVATTGIDGVIKTWSVDLSAYM